MLRRIRDFYRVLIVLVTFLMLGALMIGPDVFTYTMVYMEKSNSETSDIRIYTDREKNFLISAVGFGTLIGTYMSNYFFSRFGARYVLLVAGILSALTTAALPACLDWSYAASIVLRVVQGISYSADFGVIGLVVSSWAPQNERALFLAVLCSFTVIKSIVEMPVASAMLFAYGWRSVFYMMAGIVLGMSIVWLALYRDHPGSTPASAREIAKINEGKAAKTGQRAKVPYLKILSDVRVYAMWCATFVDAVSSLMLQMYTTKYLAMLGFTSSETALYGSISGYVLLAVRIVAGFMSDHTKFVMRWKIRVFSFLSMQLPALVMLAMALFLHPQDNRPIIQPVFIILFEALIGFTVGAHLKGAVLMSGPYAFFVVGQGQLFKSVAVLLEPLLFNVVVVDHHNGWRVFFFIHVGLLTAGFLLYMPLVSERPAEWSRPLEKCAASGDEENQFDGVQAPSLAQVEQETARL